MKNFGGVENQFVQPKLPSKKGEEPRHRTQTSSPLSDPATSYQEAKPLSTKKAHKKTCGLLIRWSVGLPKEVS
jgi:hypothetical protein